MDAHCKLTPLLLAALLSIWAPRAGATCFQDGGANCGGEIRTYAPQSGSADPFVAAGEAMKAVFNGADNPQRRPNQRVNFAPLIIDVDGDDDLDVVVGSSERADPQSVAHCAMRQNKAPLLSPRAQSPRRSLAAHLPTPLHAHRRVVLMSSLQLPCFLPVAPALRISSLRDARICRDLARRAH